jgi:hypothetical protein
MESLTWQQSLELGLKCFKKVHQETGRNVLDNYGYREIGMCEIIKTYISSLERKPGRGGDDAFAYDDGYNHIELKSRSNKNVKTLSFSCLSNFQFDKQNDPIRREYIYKYDGLGFGFYEDYEAVPTVCFFIAKDDVSKIHPIFLEKQNEKIKVFEEKIKLNKNIGYDSITISFLDILDKVEEKNIVSWLHGKKIETSELIHLIGTKQLKINQ